MKKLKMVQSQLEKEQTQQCDPSNTQTTGMKQMTAPSFLLEDEDSEESANDEEVDKYLAEIPLKYNDNCLEWWKRNEDRFPAVAQLAKQYLNIPATSVPAEQIFSTAGVVINQKQSCLKRENADMLIFLNKSLRLP